MPSTGRIHVFSDNGRGDRQGEQALPTHPRGESDASGCESHRYAVPPRWDGAGPRPELARISRAGGRWKLFRTVCLLGHWCRYRSCFYVALPMCVLEESWKSQMEE